MKKQDKLGRWYEPQKKKLSPHERFKRNTSAAVRAELRKKDRELCFDLDYLMKRTARMENGCLEWLGRWYETDGKLYTMVQRGKHGRMEARRAMWGATRGKPLPDNRLIRMTCENPVCIEPTHMIDTNRTLEAARKKLGYLP